VPLDGAATPTRYATDQGDCGFSGPESELYGRVLVVFAAQHYASQLVLANSISFVGLDSSASAVPYLASWAESAAAGTFEQIAALVDRLARRLEDTLGADSDGPAPAPALAAAQEAAAA